MLTQPTLAGATQIMLAVVILVAAVFDIRYRRIPNWLVLCGIVAGFSWNSVLSGWSGFGHAAAGLGIGFALYFPLYLLRARGAGDVKLLAAVGSITGPGNCFWLFLLTAVFGGLIALAVVAIRKRTGQTFFNLSWIVSDLLKFRAPHRGNPQLDVTSNQGLRLPHAALMAVGVAVFLVMVNFGIGVRG